MKTYRELIEAYRYRTPKPPSIIGKTAHGHYLKKYSKVGYCDSCNNVANGGERPVGLYKFRWKDKEPVEGAKPEKDWGEFCSLRCHQQHSGDEYNEQRAGRSYVKPGQYEGVQKFSASLLEELEPGEEGQCFRNVFRHINKDFDPDLSVIHGKVDDKHGKRIHHAWLETQTHVIDPTAGVKLPKPDYYKAVAPEVHHTYTPRQARRLTMSTNNFGPWTDDERSTIK